MDQEIRFDPVDLSEVQLTARLSPGQRIQRLLDAHQLVVGLIRGRLRRQHPHLSTQELNLRLIEEVTRVQRTPP